MGTYNTIKSIEPAILYFGTPVALICTVDERNLANIGPVSSVWALGRTLLIGLECGSKTYQNLIKQGECVVNIPAANLFDKVERIATLTGAQPIPDYKKTRYQYEPDKFRAGGFTRLISEVVVSPRIGECSMHFEAVLKNKMVIEDDPLIYNFRHYFGLGRELGKTFKAEI